MTAMTRLGGIYLSKQRRVNELFDFEPKDKQVEAIRKLLYDKSDLILIAKTGFGKSIIFQALPLIQEELKLASLIIVPLNLLQEEQAEKLKTIAGAHPFVLNGDTNTRKNRREIGEGVYTHSKCSDLWIAVTVGKSQDTTDLKYSLYKSGNRYVQGL